MKSEEKYQQCCTFPIISILCWQNENYPQKQRSLRIVLQACNQRLTRFGECNTFGVCSSDFFFIFVVFSLTLWFEKYIFSQASQGEP
jgi:hypothetical protein